MLILKVLLWILGIVVVFQIVVRVISKLFPSPMPYWSAFILERPMRKIFHSPSKMLDWFAVKPGTQVLELGTGGGYFIIEAAKRVSDKGKLFAVDIQPEMIARARRKVEQSDLTNIELKVADAVDLPFKDAYFDLVFMCSVLGEVPDQKAALRELYRVIKPGGTLSITEAFQDGHYILKKNLIKRVLAMGFALITEHGSFSQYTVNFQKSSK